jgi:TorA maturation chaperone TorD
MSEEKQTTTSLDLDSNLTPEDLARADLYGLLALLFYEPPSAELLKKIAQFGQDIDVGIQDESSILFAPWKELVDVAKISSVQDWQDEYENAFIGVGKQEIFLYGSYYLTGFLNEKPLAALREALLKLGLQASDDMSETEDHIACLCEVMRYLVAGEDLSICNLTKQKVFFNQHIRTWASELFEVLQNHPSLRFYSLVGSLAATFFEIEGQAFDMV